MVLEMADEKLRERKELLKRAYSITQLFEIGRWLKIPYFSRFLCCWEMDEDGASMEIASKITDDILKQIFQDYKPREWATFRGKHYQLDRGKLSLEGSWNLISDGVRKIRVKYGSMGILLLKTIVEGNGIIDSSDIKRFTNPAIAREVIGELERLGIIFPSYIGIEYCEWSIPKEALPIVEAEVKGKPTERGKEKKISAKSIEERQRIDPLSEERLLIERMDWELNSYVSDLLKNRLERTIEFGKTFSISALSAYLQELFGSILYFDSLLSITQQYGLANVEVVHEQGKTGKRTGWSLALFGDPGTGKSFATRDMILGKPSANIPAHGIPGRNRYCGGMTPARFIRIGQAYAGRTFNFIVPEFNDFFRYKGMVEPLKIAMEQGEIKYELHREVIGPYRFTSFFTVNYNVSVYERGYSVTIQDPNFRAIEDRMLCRLHRLTKERYLEIAESQMKIALGKIDVEREAQLIRDHLTLVYAIETRHSLVADRFPHKPVMITPQTYDWIARARRAILEEIKSNTLTFSARLEDKVLSFACSASLMEYFSSSREFIPVSQDALKYAIQLYVEEASIRSQEKFSPEAVLKKVFGEYIP
ncbi:MAG: hypothetical protein QW502_01115 [Candidatus Bathyarchaeia archaeon]|nr:hypothetical protein [Candidatus Bathyarchaeota archaeon]